MSVVVGKESILSWYVFLATEMDKLPLTRADWQKTRFEGFGAEKRALEHLGVPFRESPRYQWLGEVVQKTLPLP